MSATSREVIRDIQEDCFARIMASAWLSDVSVVLERKAIPEKELVQLLSARNARGGKVGACIIVLRPTVRPDADDSSGRAEVIQAFSVIEHPILNAGDLGTGKSAEEIAVELFDLFQMAAVSKPQQVFSGFPGGAIVPDDVPGMNAWEVRFRTYVKLRRTQRLTQPLIAPDEGAVPQNVTLEAAAGAAIYYTLDGSYPWSGNDQAVLYSGPLAVAAAATLRAAAYKDGMQPSDVASATFT